MVREVGGRETEQEQAVQEPVDAGLAREGRPVLEQHAQERIGPAQVLDRMTAETSAGYLSAHSWQMAPPMDDPMARHGGRCRAWWSACTSSAKPATLYGPGVIGLRPMPRLSKVTHLYSGVR